MATDLHVATTVPTVLPTNWTLADFQAHFNGIPPERIRMYPPPGTATIADVIALNDHHDCLCELIEGVLLEKTMGYFESRLAIAVAYILERYLDDTNLGIVYGADAPLRILPDQVRMPDVCFVRWDRLPGGKMPEEQVPALVPNLAVEILSPGNTAAEMQRKLDDYRAAGVGLIWYIDPRTRTATSYTSADDKTEIPADGMLRGGSVLPGFEVPLAEVFARAERGMPGGKEGS
jgi:Uma2 family endonuclease